METLPLVPRLEVVCQGDPREMGLAQGRVLKSKIQAAVESSLAKVMSVLGKPWWMPEGLFILLAKLRARRSFGAPLRAMYPEFNERLLGIAEGAELDLKTTYLINALESSLSLTAGRTAIMPAPGACSAIAVRGSRSANGEPIIARNFDYLSFLQPFCSLRESQPRNGYRSVEFIMAPMVGAIDGINEHGLSITYDYAYTLDGHTVAAPLSMLISEALGRCRTVQECADLICSRKRWGGGILMLADATGDIASLEISSTRSFLRRPAAGEDVLFHTNAYSSPLMREVEVSPNAIFGPSAEPALRGVRVLESAERRLASITQALGAGKLLSPEDLSLVLADHGADGTGNDNTVCVHGEARSTVACLQLYPKTKRIRVSYSSACRAQYQEIAL